MKRRQARLRRLSRELPRKRGAWRGAAIARAVRILLQAGGIDLAGSLAYFTILSLLPAVALAIMTIAVFGEPEVIEETLTATLLYYFPTSQSLIQDAVENLLRGSLAIGLVAFVSLVMGANGLFMAATRSVNRVFGAETQKVLRITVLQVTLTTTLVLLFLLSIGVSASLQLAVRFSEGIAESTGGLSGVVLLALGAASTLLPAFFTMTLFALVYYLMPNVRLEWRNAVFGAVTAIVLFEAGKHLFFWFTGLAAQRNAVYGPISSFVLLLMWGYVAGMIFLYGAALTRAAGELRPKGGEEPRR
ncbi:MAG: YihY/virulence factor BrkB family protein [Chloroflexota bacterium]|nr:YihY/virulence factor BrkB family protein [Chloroflexota bacterium]MDE2886271.1 YihY/virulence factor BrkB family protein [Chloroflexota bacterium]